MDGHTHDRIAFHWLHFLPVLALGLEQTELANEPTSPQTQPNGTTELSVHVYWSIGVLAWMNGWMDGWTCIVFQQVESGHTHDRITFYRPYFLQVFVLCVGNVVHKVAEFEFFEFEVA